MNSAQCQASAALTAPHFVGIGAPRCGTTWVFKMLRLHPQIWIPWKELHFFDSLDPETESGFSIQSKRFRFRRGWPYAIRRLAAGALPGAGVLVRRFYPLRAVQAPGLRWTMRYFLGDATLQWYGDLFREGAQKGLRCGEITPAYFMLSPRGITDFASALPRVRVFLLLRDPIQWAWSDVCKRVRALGKRPTDLSDEELIARCAVPTGRSRADFGSNLSHWLSGFPRERLFIGFHDHIRAEPDAFLDRLCTFIGIDPFPAPLSRLFREHVNSSAHGAPIPRTVERYIAARYRGEAAVMAELVGGAAEHWHANMERVLRQEWR